MLCGWSDFWAATHGDCVDVVGTQSRAFVSLGPAGGCATPWLCRGFFAGTFTQEDDCGTESVID